MKKTKEYVLRFVQKELLSNGNNKDGITTSVVAESLNLQRSNASTILNELVREGKLDKTLTRPVLYQIPKKRLSKHEYEEKKLIGVQGSLSKPLQIAKAAILYPTKSLNVLVSAKPGCGITYFVYWMFLFAKESGVVKEDAPFIKVNCRHYKEHLEELDSILFGRGGDDQAFDKCCFSLAKGGMLFIDNVDLLNAHQQSIIAEFLESNFLFSENRNKFIDGSDIFLILSCNPKYLSRYNQRIPMIVELPELKDRPLEEKYDLINYFFSMEAINAKRNIELSQEVMEALLLCDYSRNVKELKMEIKKACATACVRVVDDLNSSIEINIYDFNTSIQKSLVKMHLQSKEILNIVGNQNKYIYNFDKKYQDTQHDDLYDELHAQYKELLNRGINTSTIQEIINNHVTTLFKKYNYYQGFDESYDIEQLSKIVDPQIIEMVQEFINISKIELKKNLKSNVFYGLCLHMNSLLSIQSDTSRIDNEQVKRIVQNYPKEYALSVQFAQQFIDKFGINLSLEEIVIIAMFLIKTEDEIDNGHPVLLYILHGEGTASSLREVTNSLIKCNNVYGYDLTLEKDNIEAMNEIQSLILKIDNGQGVVVIYDMGSIKTMLDTISKEIDVKIRYIHIPITLLGLDIARKCVQEEDIDYVYHTTLLEFKNLFMPDSTQKEIIITLCHTGEGGAYQLKQYIDQYSKLGIKTIALAISNRDVLIQRVMELKKIYNIHCFVGAYDPKLLGIPFISMTKFFENSPEDIDRILMFEPIHTKKVDYSEIYSFLEEQFQNISVPKLKSILPSIIDQFEIIYSLTSEQKVGLFMHIACMLEKCKERHYHDYVNSEEINQFILDYEEDFKTVSKILKPLEKEFKVIIEDSQIVTIIMILNKI